MPEPAGAAVLCDLAMAGLSRHIGAARRPPAFFRFRRLDGEWRVNKGRHAGFALVLAGCCASLVALPALALSDGEAGRIVEPALSARFNGATYEGTYRNGIAWREVYIAGGRVIYSDDIRSATGDWFVRDDLLCTFYDTDLQGGCFVVMRRSENCLDFYAVDLATNEPDAGWAAVRDGTGWTARGGRADLMRTCPEDFVS